MVATDLPPPRVGHPYVWYFPKKEEQISDYVIFIQPLNNLMFGIQEKAKAKRRYSLNKEETKIVAKIQILRRKLLAYYLIDEWIDAEMLSKKH